MAMSNTFHSSSKAHAISGGGKLASVQKHNERGYFSFEYNPSLIHSLIGDVHTIVEDVTNYINEKFQSAIDDFNSKKTRNDRKINKTPFEYFCDNKKLDIANEAIFQLGDKDFWSATRIEEPIVRNGKNILLKDYPPEVKEVMDEIFKLQAEAYENIYKTHKDEILKRIKQDYEYSKEVMKDLDAEELKAFEKIAPLKVKERKKKIKEFPEDKKERFERFLKASSTIDLVEDKRIISRIENEEMTIKLLNLVAHYDEFSPHAHGVSVCSIKGYKNGLNERVAKSVVLNKWTLSVIQDKLHEIAKQEMAKHPEIFTEPLAEKQSGRNYDFTTDGYKRYQKDELEKEITKLEHDIVIKQKEYEEVKEHFDKLQVEAESEKQRLEETLEEKKEEISQKVSQLENTCDIKNDEQYEKAKENVAADIAAIETFCDISMNAYWNAQDDTIGYNSKNILNEFTFDISKLLDKLNGLTIFDLIDRIRKAIEDISLYERIKKIKDGVASVLENRLDKALHRASESSKTTESQKEGKTQKRNSDEYNDYM